MRFERIFEDLEGRFAHHEQQEMRAVSEDLARAERAQLTLADRLRGAGTQRLTLHVGTGLRLDGTVEGVGSDWVALRDSAGGQRILVPLGAIALVHGLPTRARLPEESLRSPLGLGSVLREIARDRSIVRLETTAGGVIGRIAAVGADTLDLHALPTGESVLVPGSERLTVAIAALQAVLPR
ncbi:MAG: hypothetical protein ACTMII_01485 [Brachybacterium sp.]|uniref:hypothetical protein n=1 Tax=unclassified Brachybacterium TaxID=2623841 RepID=UPI003F938CBA